jgi:hypothetical protein
MIKNRNLSAFNEEHKIIKINNSVVLMCLEYENAILNVLYYSDDKGLQLAL